MDPVRNPFAPGAGNPPPELAGRSEVLSNARVALQRAGLMKPTRSQILVGLRGVGKTVLLNKIKEMADDQKQKTFMIEAHESKPLPELIVPSLRSILFSLSTKDRTRELARAGLRILKAFASSVKVQFGELELGLGINQEHGVADSGDLEADLPILFAALGRCARAAEQPIVMLIDEMQYLSEKEFSALIMAIHKINQEQHPVLMFGAGLPQILGLAGESKSYAERLFIYPNIGALTEKDARTAVEAPLAAEGVAIENAAVARLLEVTQRYPYFIQQWAHDAWNVAENETITAHDMEAATKTALATLDESFFRVRFDRCTPSEKRYMRALASFGPGAHRSGDIADQLGLKTTSVGPTRGKLIKKGMIYSPQHGDTAFTVPLFDEYMRRAMP